MMKNKFLLSLLTPVSRSLFSFFFLFFISFYFSTFPLTNYFIFSDQNNKKLTKLPKNYGLVSLMFSLLRFFATRTGWNNIEFVFRDTELLCLILKLNAIARKKCEFRLCFTCVSKPEWKNSFHSTLKNLQIQ